MTSLIIPSADASPQSEQMLENLLWSIESQGIHEYYKVCVCFDLCHPNFAEKFVTKYKFPDYLINTGNRLNFAKNSNLGLRKAFTEYKDHAIVVNQDTIIPSKQYLDTIFGEGIVSPQQVTLQGTKEQILDSLNADNAVQPNPVERGQHNKLVGFFLFINYTVMEKIGFFDERYVASFEDDDMCVTARLAGLPVETVGTRVHHEVSKCGAYTPEHLQINWAKFRYKWTIPDSISHINAAQWILENHSFIEEMRNK